MTLPLLCRKTIWAWIMCDCSECEYKAAPQMEAGTENPFSGQLMNDLMKLEASFNGLSQQMLDMKQQIDEIDHLIELGMSAKKSTSPVGSKGTKRSRTIPDRKIE